MPRKIQTFYVMLLKMHIFSFRLLAQCPDKMLTNKDDWFKMVYPFVISNTPKV